jgi:hypoxanthine-guanine phosphoribosyltransferase
MRKKIKQKHLQERDVLLLEDLLNRSRTRGFLLRQNPQEMSQDSAKQSVTCEFS